jgi:hypothetical protein
MKLKTIGKTSKNKGVEMSDFTTAKTTKVTFPVLPHQYSMLKRFFQDRNIPVTDHDRNEVSCSLRVSRDSVSIYLPSMEVPADAP